MTNRWDETWHRLREWTAGQGPSERMAAQVLSKENFSAIDPSHPLGGPDGGKDATVVKDGKRWIMAVYFPRGQQEFKSIKSKFLADLAGVAKNVAVGMAFVTNQELELAERLELQEAAGSTLVEMFHLERVTTILDRPDMTSVRKQFLGMDDDSKEAVAAVGSLAKNVTDATKRLESLQTGGTSFCYWMLYHYDMEKNIAQNFVIIKKGEFPLYDVRLRIRDMDGGKDVVNRPWGELNAPADYMNLKWPLAPHAYYRVFFFARNGSWNQDLILKRSSSAKCWLAATRVLDTKGEAIFEQLDNGFVEEFGNADWRP